MVKKKTISKKLDKHFKNKKKLTITLAAALIVTTVLIGTAFIYNEINISNTKNQTIAESDKPAVDHLKDLAFDAFTNKKYTQSRALYDTAETQYQYIVDNTADTATHDEAVNNVIDCKAQIRMIDYLVSQQ